MEIEHFVIDSVCLFNSTPKSVYFMLYFKCFAMDKIASFVTLNPAVKIM